jgi:hypothetical protein
VKRAQTALRVVGTTPSADAVWSAPDGVLLDVAPRLCRLLGREGYRALLERALHLAGENYPILRMVRPAIAPAGRLVGLPPDTSWRSEQVFEALAATHTVLLGLLVQLLGPELVELVLGGDADALASTITTCELAQGATA